MTNEEFEEYAKKYNERMKDEDFPEGLEFLKKIYSNKWIYCFDECIKEDGSLNFDDVIVSKFYRLDNCADPTLDFIHLCNYNENAEYNKKNNCRYSWRFCVISKNEGELCRNSTIWFKEQNDTKALLAWTSANNF